MNVLDLIYQLERVEGEPTTEVEIVTPHGNYKVDDVVFSAGKVYIRGYSYSNTYGK